MMTVGMCSAVAPNATHTYLMLLLSQYGYMTLFSILHITQTQNILVVNQILIVESIENKIIFNRLGVARAVL